MEDSKASKPCAHCGKDFIPPVKYKEYLCRPCKRAYGRKKYVISMRERADNKAKREQTYYGTE